MDYYTKEEVDRLVERVRLQTIEDILKSLPFVVRNMVTSASRRYELANKFYEENKDLANDKSLSAAVIEEMDAKYPGMPFEELLEKAAPEIRRRLTLRQDVNYHRTGRPSLEQLDNSLNGMV